MLRFDSEQSCDHAGGEHVDTTAPESAFEPGRVPISHSDRDHPALRLRYPGRDGTALRIGEYDGRFVERDFGRELVDFFPIQRDEQIVAVRVAFDGYGRNLHHPCRLTATHLR